jgi:16S rRNA (guanine527-N7)-methyltransferase
MNLKNKLHNIDLKFDDTFYERCEKYVLCLQEWGKIHNLSSVKDLERESIESNIIDSVYPLKFLDSYTSLADVGTGAGYPGMILAIANPNIKSILIEPRSKRVAFLKFVKSLLDLRNVEVIESKVEDVLNVKVDLVTSRAVTNTKLLLNITQNIATNTTQYLFYKGSLANKEVKECEINNYSIINVGEFRNYLYIDKKGEENDF